MEKDELVQALGVFFTVATLALAFNLTSSGLLTAANALPGALDFTLDDETVAEIERIVADEVHDPVGPEFMAPPLATASSLP